MVAGLTTRELSEATWPDYAAFFERPGEWGVCWCTYYQRQKPTGGSGLTGDQKASRNRKEKKRRVREGRAHGIMVYINGEPVGWCQFGLAHEIPRIDSSRRYRRLTPDYGGERLWRISCFCVDRKHRGMGVASAALAAALDSIRKMGGGVVEAYPVARRGALATWFGTVPMFEREGFKTVAPFGKSNVLMTKRV